MVVVWCWDSDERTPLFLLAGPITTWVLEARHPLLQLPVCCYATLPLTSFSLSTGGDNCLDKDSFLLNPIVLIASSRIPNTLIMNNNVEVLKKY